ncbi:polysaccharide pyruvyl transferase family protein [uncultured Bacteroides sp.]|uniref:polysaccharide pyruvyl transferase family protein n=1 Tax=uncultured Bacteroides sp. TaxID=162156 RepID=UPI00280ADFAF|nr:polysaccharide pyruvyl transferase family protein [uncultured Bacteroides sp.]
MNHKKYIIISGLDLKDNNRGTAALGYGAISFLQQHKILKEGITLINLRCYKNFLKPHNRKSKEETLFINGISWHRKTIGIFIVEWWLLSKLGILLPWSKTRKILKSVEYVAAINGGDGFSDIYGTDTFHSRLLETWVAMKMNIPVIQLPQTLGPFKKKNNYEEARRILQYSQAVYVRDEKFVPELKKMGVNYELTKDLSAYMQPESWDIDIKPNAIGVNVSGLAYSNEFRTLAGQFDAYPELIDCLIKYFRDKGHTVYLIPHSYNYKVPETNNDDMIACKAAYEKLKDKTNVILVDKDLTSPQVKYVISKMNFFIGTRMHANFAAIYSGVPLFGLAYSYKFEGAFNANGLDGKNQTTMINNISKKEIDSIIKKIEKVYSQIHNKE